MVLSEWNDNSQRVTERHTNHGTVGNVKRLDSGSASHDTWYIDIHVNKGHSKLGNITETFPLFIKDFFVIGFTYLNKMRPEHQVVSYNFF